MSKGFAVLLALAVLPLWGCASSTPPPTPVAQPAQRPFDNVRRLAVVASGESRFAVLEHSAEPGRTFDEVLKWNAYGSLFRPLAVLVHQGINWLVGLDRAADTAPDASGLSPRLVVTDAFARALAASGRFDTIRTLEREPIGEDRHGVDAIARLMVPEWGLVRVRAGEPDLMSAFADVRAEMTIPGTGVILWETSQDVTDPERLPLQSFVRDRRFTRQQLIDVLERAGQRLASELLYARSAGR
jgi:hypothetical protein